MAIISAQVDAEMRRELERLAERDDRSISSMCAERSPTNSSAPRKPRGAGNAASVTSLLCVFGMTRRPCIVCGTPSNGPRCRQHTRTKPGRSWSERQRRRATVQAHIAQHGQICPGYSRPPHYAEDLTAEHIYPRSIYGDNGPLAVLCLSCNSAKAPGPGGTSESWPKTLSHHPPTRPLPAPERGARLAIDK
jgi:hypothetical protein